MKTERQLKEISSPFIIYGAHLVASECFRYLVMIGKKKFFRGFCVTNTEKNPKILENFPVMTIEKYTENKNVLVVIAMPKRHHNAVEDWAEKHGFHNFICVSLEEMSAIKGRLLIAEADRHKEFPYCLEVEKNDPGWLSLREKDGQQYQSSATKQCRYPTLFYRSIKDMLDETQRANLFYVYNKVLGEHSICGRAQTLDEQNSKKGSLGDIVSIYMAFSVADIEMIRNCKIPEWVFLLRVGCATEKIAENQIVRSFYDNKGDNISDLNGLFSEMTGAYWIWKNAPRTPYKGLCHYRRHFCVSGAQLERLLADDMDVLLTTPRYIPFGIGKMFLAETTMNPDTYKALMQAVAELDPQESTKFEDYLGNGFYYPNNMTVARTEIYDAYCAYVFPIMFRMLEIESENKNINFADRHMGYVAELLTSWFFVKNKGKYKVAVADYKLTEG